MPTVLSRSVLGAIFVILLAGPGIVQAATTIGPVGVRVEGTSSTILPLTNVYTVLGSYTPVGKSTACPGTSAAEALDLATLPLAAGTTGGWDGTFDSGLGDYFVNVIGGEKHHGDGTYWSFWWDHAQAGSGICGQPLSPGDQILFFPDCFANCPAGFVSPRVLGLTASATVAQKGEAVTFTVTSYGTDLAADPGSPVSGATVSGGGSTATTAANGQAMLTFPNVGSFAVQASAPNSVRTETRTVCVHDGNDGTCGTAAPAGTTPSPTPSTSAPCVHHGDDGLCGTIDRTPPRGHLSIAEGTRFSHGHGPRTIVGHVDADASGLRDVLLRLTRVVTHRRCDAYSATHRKWAKSACGVSHAPSFSVGRSASFAYLLPQALARGRYTVDVEAIDAAGNHDAPAPARNQIVFRVA